jgi:diacylglycerol kinase (ATP)
MPRIKLIVNPWAEHGRAGFGASGVRPLIEELAAAHSGPGGPYQVEWVGTVYPGQATDMTHEAAQAGYDIVTAVGGDGTVHEVVNGLMRVEPGKRPALGVIPTGSGNDFATNLGLPTVPGQAARHLFSGQMRTIDVGRITDGVGRNEYWNNSVGIGFTGAVNINARKMTRISGFLMYFMAALQAVIRNHYSYPVRVDVDGQAFEEHIATFSVTNGPREGGGFPVTPDAKMDDGLLSYMFVTQVGRLMMLRLLLEATKGRHVRFSQVECGTAKVLTVEAGRGVPIHTDGEVFGSWEADIRYVKMEIVPAAIRVVMSTDT